MTENARKLGILAGSGPLPAAVIQAAAADGRDVFVLAFQGETDLETPTTHDHAWVRLGEVGRTVRLLHEASVDDVVMIGAINRPSLSDLKLDARGMQLLAKLSFGAVRGDDYLLSIIVRELEQEGFRVVGADELIRPMLAPEGVMTRIGPDGAARRDIAIGLDVIRRLGDLDIGQAVVVQEGRVLGVEAVEGTDALIARVGGLRRGGPGGVLIKAKKPGQDRRADLPTIGDRTIASAIEAGLSGIAVEAGQCLIVNRSLAIARADDAGLFIAGITGSG